MSYRWPKSDADCNRLIETAPRLLDALRRIKHITYAAPRGDRIRQIHDLASSALRGTTHIIAPNKKIGP